VAAASAADLISGEDAEWLTHAWRTVSRIRNAVTLVRGKPGDHLPRDTREKAAVASVMGYPPGASDELVNDYMRHSRRTRSVVDRVFWE
jgi:glutamate-ammonia-ligase adenylyltransferase